MNIYIKRIIFVTQLVLIALISFSIVQAAGEVDPTFVLNVGSTSQESVTALALQSDGKILLRREFYDGANSLPPFDVRVVSKSFNEWICGYRFRNDKR